MADAFRYDAFISYRHREPDKQWADWLVRALETYVPPRGVRKALEAQDRAARVSRVFRDEDETSAGGDLNQQLKDALDQSRTLIVVCSRNTPGSRWVNQEVEHFESLGRALRVLPLLVEGEPSEAFPPALRDQPAEWARIAGPATPGARDVEQLAADVRPVAGKVTRDIKRRALLKLVAGCLDLRYDDLYQRDLRRRRWRAASVVTTVALLLAGSLSWFAWTRTDAYQLNAVLRDGPPLVASAVDDDAAAWVQALAYTGRVDDAFRDAEATVDFGGGQVKVGLSLADVLAQQRDTRAQEATDSAISRIAGFGPQFRAELYVYTADRLAARGLKDDAARVAMLALPETGAIDNVAERVTAVENLARRLVSWSGGLVQSRREPPDNVVDAILLMETARASKRAGLADQSQRQALAGIERARALEAAAMRVYLLAYLTDAAAGQGIEIPARFAGEAAAAAHRLTAEVERSQALRMAVEALVHVGNLDMARAQLREITIQEDRDTAVTALIGGYARHGRARDVGSLLQDNAGRDDLDIYGLLSAAAEVAAESNQVGMLALLDRYASPEQQIEMRVIAAERQRALARDNREALSAAMSAVLAADSSLDTSDQRSRIVTELTAAGRVAEAKTVAASMTDPHDHAFALIAIASEALARSANSEATALLAEAEALERQVQEPDLAAHGLKEIARLVRAAGDIPHARELLGESLRLAASQGESGSSTVADVLAELARQGEWRLARIIANASCTASDRLRVYAAILSPRANGLPEPD